MSKNTKLELTWIGKDKRPRLEPRVLIEDPSKSYHASVRHGDKDIFDNILIHGDNLLALKALEQEYVGRVKCIYIDPPYNTGAAFPQYDDGLEHSIWLGLMRERLTLLCELLANDGSIWISIDDREGAYLKVICDEIFGRDNYVSTIHWQRAYSPKGDSKSIATAGEHILVYKKSDCWFPNKMPRTAEMDKKYKNPDNDFAPWTSSDAFGPGAATHQGMVYAIQHPFSGELIYPYANACWRYEQNEMLAIMRGWAEYELKEIGDADKRAAVCGINVSEVRKGVKAIVLVNSVEESKKHAEKIMERGKWPKLYFTSGGKGGIRRKTYLTNVEGPAPTNWWPHEEVGHTDEAKKEVIKVFGGVVTFATPKPERLISRVLSIASNPGDLVLDSFLGSGTTAAVAHKMGRRWIGVELGDHCYTHCQPRLVKVIDGEQGGISKAVKWQGGGGFRFYELAPTLIKEDSFGQKIINPQYDPEKLAEAVCKLEGFTYAPSETEYFIHGHSTEHDFIYVTTNYLKTEHLQALSARVGDERTLLICCKGFKSESKFTNLTVKKIPKAVLDRCEYGHDDYSLNVKNLPMAEKEPEQGEWDFE